MKGKFRIKESKNVLFWFAMILGIIMIGMMLVKFFLPEVKFPENLGIFYVVILIAYVMVKEVSRWVGEESSSKLGENLVFLWAGGFVLMQLSGFILNLSGFDQGKFVAPDEMLGLSVEVVAIYTCSEVSKKLHNKKK